MTRNFVEPFPSLPILIWLCLKHLVGSANVRMHAAAFPLALLSILGSLAFPDTRQACEPLSHPAFICFVSSYVCSPLPENPYASCDTVSCKTVPMFGTFVVYTIFRLSAWESRLELAGARDIQALSYKYLFGSCDFAQRVWRYSHFKTEILLERFCNFW